MNLFDQITSSKILVVGDLMLDRYLVGDTSRISPEAPVPVVKVSEKSDKIGGAGNVALNVAALGAKVGLLGIVGDDLAGGLVKSIIEKEQQIQSHILVSESDTTISKTRIISRAQQVVRLDEESRFSTGSSTALLATYKEILADYDCVILSDYNKGTLQFSKELIEVAKASNKLVLVDPKLPSLDSYRGADFITPNLSEFHLLGGDSSSEDSILLAASSLRLSYNIGNILLTRSEDGMSLISDTSKTDFAAEVHQVVDVTGAGDTVIAVLATFLASGVNAVASANLANIAAGIVVKKLGASVVTLDEIKSIWKAKAEVETSTNTINSDDVETISQLKSKGYRMVFTNGCFDILHAGHVDYLNKSRKLGDYLIVGLNTDDSISRLKGDSRPINKYFDRALVLSSLACVDFVLPFGSESDDTPLELIKQVAPDVLVKGGDYSAESIVGYEFVTSNGGLVTTIDLLPDRSTTRTIDSIKSR